MKLYTYHRSSAAYRVRIALGLKGLAREDVALHLPARAQQGEAYLALNPQGLVPTLIDGDVAIGQSMAILEYLEEPISNLLIYFNGWMLLYTFLMVPKLPR